MTSTHTHHFKPTLTGTHNAYNVPDYVMQCPCGERPADAALRRHSARTRSAYPQTVRPAQS